jgi:hypothetical protein
MLYYILSLLLLILVKSKHYYQRIELYVSLVSFFIKQNNLSLYFTLLKKLFPQLNSNNSFSNITGKNYNITDFFLLLSLFIPDIDNFGANSTVNYFTTIFPTISYIDNSPFPLLSIKPNDCILYTIHTPNDQWLQNHNLFSFTPYFYTYTNNNITTPVFATVDITIQFFDKFKLQDSTIKICVTPCKTTGNYFAKKGYIISKLPIEFISKSTFLPIFRVGLIPGKPFTKNINTFITSKYFSFPFSSNSTNIEYYYSKDLITNYPTSLLPFKDETFIYNLNQYKEIINYLSSSLNSPSTTLSKYLSNFYDTKYALDNFFESITVNPPAQIQANNTGECYYNSLYIDLESLTQPYLYILSINQNLMKTGLTSNIQIYNQTDNKVIENGTILTSNDLPNFSSPTYPYTTNDLTKFPLFQLNSILISSLLQKNITSIIIVERISYNPINFYASSYLYQGVASLFYGNQLTTEMENYLQTKYNIGIYQIPIPN